MDGSTGVSAVLDVDHKNGKSKEPHAHAKTEPVDCLVAHKHFTVGINLQATNRGASPIFTEVWDLQQTKSYFYFIKPMYRLE